MKVVATLREKNVYVENLNDFSRNFCKKEGLGKISSLVLYHNLKNHQTFHLDERKRMIMVGRHKGIFFDYISNGEYLVKTSHGDFTIFVQEV